MDKSGAETMPTTTESPPAPSAFPRESVRRGRNRDHERRRVRRVEHGETSLSAQRRVGGVAIAKTHTGTRAGTCLAPTWRSSGTVGAAATDPTRSQSQAEQQPPRGGPALLPFVPSGRLVGFTRDDRIQAIGEARWSHAAAPNRSVQSRGSARGGLALGRCRASTEDDRTGYCCRAAGQRHENSPGPVQRVAGLGAASAQTAQQAPQWPAGIKRYEPTARRGQRDGDGGSAGRGACRGPAVNGAASATRLESVSDEARRLEH